VTFTLGLYTTEYFIPKDEDPRLPFQLPTNKKKKGGWNVINFSIFHPAGVVAAATTF